MISSALRDKAKSYLEINTKQLFKHLQSDFSSSLNNCLYEQAHVYSFLFRLPSDVSKKYSKFFKTFLTTVKNSQKSDGSWSSQENIDYPVDKIITTLMIANSLVETQMSFTNQIEKAKVFIASNINNILQLENDRKTFAFEAILSVSIKRAIDNGIFSQEDNISSICSRLQSKVESNFAHKIHGLYSKKGTIHSLLDGFPEIVDWNKVKNFQEDNGSMGIYPSSTIELLKHLEISDASYKKGLNYISRILQDCKGDVPQFFPSENFERIWSLVALFDSPLILRSQDLQIVLQETGVDGVSVTKEFSIHDVDTTAMLSYLRLLTGREETLEYLYSFYDESLNGFYTYENENRFSFSANIHVLQAINKKSVLTNGSFINESKVGDMFVSTLSKLIEARSTAGYLKDKWHLSDIYTNSHYLELLVDITYGGSISFEKSIQDKIKEEIKHTVDWLLDKKGEDLWGSLEEKAYAIRALKKTNISEDSDYGIDNELLLEELLTVKSEDVPPLWIGKTLYKSTAIIEANRLSSIAYMLNNDS